MSELKEALNNPQANSQAQETKPKTKKSKKKILIILAVITFMFILCTIVSAILVYFLVLKKETDDGGTTQEESEDDYTGWKTYTNEKCGYTLNYPADYVVEEDDKSVFIYQENFITFGLSIECDPQDTTRSVEGLEIFDMQDIEVDRIIFSRVLLNWSYDSSVNYGGFLANGFILEHNTYTNGEENVDAKIDINGRYFVIEYTRPGGDYSYSDLEDYFNDLNKILESLTVEDNLTSTDLEGTKAGWKVYSNDDMYIEEMLIPQDWTNEVENIDYAMDSLFGQVSKIVHFYDSDNNEVLNISLAYYPLEVDDWCTLQGHTKGKGNLATITQNQNDGGYYICSISNDGEVYLYEYSVGIDVFVRLDAYSEFTSEERFSQILESTDLLLDLLE